MECEESIKAYTLAILKKQHPGKRFRVSVKAHKDSLDVEIVEIIEYVEVSFTVEA